MSPRPHDDFYVGYLPAAPPALAHWLRPRVASLLLASLALAAALATAQSPFARATFEFGTTTTLVGQLVEGAIPRLEVERPGAVSPSTYLLVGFGKHGAAEHVRGLDGSRVEVTGTLIHRDGMTMVELAPGGVRALTAGARTLAPSTAGPELTLRGEIVDSKCFLGVMKPGNLKPHRACAVRCISGGVPPVLLVRDAAGNAHYHLLVGPGGRAIHAELLPFVAEPVEIRGKSVGYPGLQILEIDPADIRRLP